MPREEIDFSAPDFDASKLTKNQLRSLLGDHGVVDLPPSTARKEELIRLLEREVIRPAQKKPKTLGAPSKVRPTSHGITFMDGSGRVGSPRAPKSFGPGKEQPAPDGPRKRGRPRKKVLRGEEDAEVSPFSDENPFQTPAKGEPRLRARSSSKQPATAAERRVSPAKRTEPAPAAKAVGGAGERAPRIVSPAKKRLASPAGRPVSPAKHPVSPLPFPERIVFEPTAQRQDRLLVVCSALGALARFLFRLVLLGCIGFYIYFSHFNRFPYCDTGAKSPALSFRSPRSFADSFSRFCIECPANGHCRDGKLRCDEKYTERRGLWFSSSCVIDKRKLSTLEDMLNTARRLLNQRLGRSICGKLAPDESAGVTGPEIKRMLVDHRVGGAPAAWNEAPDRFDEFWRLFVEEVRKDAPKYGIIYRDGRLLGTEPLVAWQCRIQRYAAMVVQRHRRPLISAVLLGILLVLFRRYLGKRNRLAGAADELIQKVVRKLMEQEMASRRRSSVSSTLSINQLRDSLLIGTAWDQETRRAIWDNVYRVVSRNSNVREYVSTIRGEQHKVWEWVGIVPTASASEGEEMREIKGY